MNHPYFIEFLYERLQTPGNNILQENILIILSSLEMTVLARLYAIIHITIFISTRWLAGNFIIIANYNFSVPSIGRMVDGLETALEAI